MKSGLMQGDVYRIMTPSVFRLVHFKPFHYAFLSAAGHKISLGEKKEVDCDYVPVELAARHHSNLLSCLHYRPSA